MRQFTIPVVIALYMLCLITGQGIVDAQAIGCGCCPSPRCQTKPNPCSSNSDCECLWMTMTGGGICADTVISCKDLLPCGNDNKTCSVPNSVCVNNTRCNIPVCYPIERASSQRCPLFFSTNLTDSTNLPDSTTLPGSTNLPDNLRQGIVDGQAIGCGCCPSSHCQTKLNPCSSNSDCECLWMTMTGGGMCADTVISCKDLLPCGNDNKTCSAPNSACVNNTRCNIPVCYPIERASSQRCPPFISTNLTDSTNLPDSTTLPGSTNLTDNLRQGIVDGQAIGCGCCPSPRCQTKPNPCSSNSDCECLWMTMTGRGMCADTVISCKDILPCGNDNKTCSAPNSVCVNNTRCNIPVCYPIERASSQRCPPFISINLTDSTNLTDNLRKFSS
ncbi:unnamed protein product [Rotaria sordida]|uniref:Uncharacterized protein n=1 Tax=Rotaria sordida TaxID=392033 RepID=A0A815H818_9BILA|nr:unnamed protein product [Rotaria sordida]